jgi:Ca2+-binding RTX toxin-like protein
MMMAYLHRFKFNRFKEGTQCNELGENEKYLRLILFWIASAIISLMVVFVMTGNQGSAQEDSQTLGSSSVPSATGLGMSINTPVAPNATDASTEIPIQDRITVGSFGDDRITGSNESEVMIGLLGADTIRGEGGDDNVQGNEDLDKLYGEDGNDLLQGGAATDQVYGGIGDDILSGGLGDNFLVGEEGDDKLYGGSEDDIMQGGLGADYFDCGEGIDIIIDFNIEEGDDNAGNCEEISGR